MGPHSATATNLPVADDTTIDLSLLGANLWRHRRLIVASALLCAVVSFGLNLLRTSVYEAVATLLVTRNADSSPTAPPNVQTFLTLIESGTVAQKVIDEFALVRRPLTVFGSGEKMTVSSFLSDSLQARQLAGANLIQLRVRLGDPALAARVANRVAGLAITFNREVNEKEVILVREGIGAQLAEARQSLDEAKRALLAFRTSAQIDTLRKDVDRALDERSELPAILTDAEAERARLVATEEALKNRQRFVTTRRSIDGDPALMEAARASQASGGSATTLGLSLDDQALDRVYESLEVQAAQSRSELAALESRRREIAGARGRDAALAPLLTKLYEHESQLARLELETKLRETIYGDLAHRYEQSSVEVASHNSELEVIDPALVPTARVSPTVVLNTVLGGALGLIVAVFAVVAASYLRQHAE